MSTAITPLNQPVFRIILALRARDTDNWRFETVISRLQGIHQVLLPYILDYAEVRFVTRYLFSQGRPLSERLIERHAAAYGWRHESKHWIPIEAPLHLPPPRDAETADVTFTIKRILFGKMVVEASVGTRRLEIAFDDVEDNPVILVRFIQILAAGGRPHAAFADSTRCNFIVDDGPTQDMCRLIIESRHPERKAKIDVFTNRLALIENFRGLAWEIARHTHFAHHFLHSGCLPTDDHERVVEIHNRHWADCIKRGLYSEDDDDIEKELLGARLVLDLRLPHDLVEEAIQYKEMMQSLEIPRVWQVRFGLTAMVTTEDIDQILK